MSVVGWKGRDDYPQERWHHLIQNWTPQIEGGICFAGFCSDEGVRRNEGRIGAAKGPAALREMMSNLTQPPTELYDAGDTGLVDNDLESGQIAYSQVLTGAINRKSKVIGLGGGHEIAYGSFLGLSQSNLVQTGESIGILNLDSHFDLRKGVPSSGTPFAQALSHSENRPDYMAVGISPASNSGTLFERAKQFGASYLLDSEVSLNSIREIEKFIDQVHHVYVTLDLDVLPASVAPGVSAPAARGVQLEIIERILITAAKSGTIMSEATDTAHTHGTDADTSDPPPECPFCTYMRSGGCGVQFDVRLVSCGLMLVGMC